MDPSAPQDVEVEWQLDAQDLRPVARWIEAASANGAARVEIGPGRTVTNVDTYLDTRDRSLDRSGYSLRVRQVSRRAPVATVKSLERDGSDPGGPLVRLELEEAVGGVEPAPPARAPGRVGERIRALVGRRALAPLFEVQTRRRVFPPTAAGEPSGGLAVAAPGAPVAARTWLRDPRARALRRRRRVEVEAHPQARGAVEPFVESLRL